MKCYNIYNIPSSAKEVPPSFLHQGPTTPLTRVQNSPVGGEVTKTSNERKGQLSINHKATNIAYTFMYEQCLKHGTYNFLICAVQEHRHSLRNKENIN